MVEFGLVGQTMHKVDEATPVADLEVLDAHLFPHHRALGYATFA